MSEKSHFAGKTALEHLKEARKKGARATSEMHGVEISGHVTGAIDAAKETAIYALFVWIIGDLLHLPPFEMSTFTGVFLLGVLLWKTGRSGLLAWSRLERVNTLILDERNEIMRNRDEEKQELTEIYRAKGFTGDLLEKVIDVLMADDNKLLAVMLEEELGVNLESYEHPLKQSVGACLGVFVSSLMLLGGMWIHQPVGLFVTSYLIIFLASLCTAYVQQIRIINHLVWSLATATLSSFGLYFFTKFLVSEIL